MLSDASEAGPMQSPVTEAIVTVDDGARIWTATHGRGPRCFCAMAAPGLFDTLEPLGRLIDGARTSPCITRSAIPTVCRASPISAGEPRMAAP
jgi:hypothetical protein